MFTSQILSNQESVRDSSTSDFSREVLMCFVSMFEKFASKYFVGELNIVSYSGDKPVIGKKEFNNVNRQLYGDGEYVIDHLPLVMKVDKRHLPVYGENGIPARTLAIPHRVVDSLSTRPPEEDKSVFLATPDASLDFIQQW